MSFKPKSLQKSSALSSWSKIALLSVDLVESVDLVFVDLVVNCTVLRVPCPALRLVKKRSWICPMSLQGDTYTTDYRILFRIFYRLNSSRSQTLFLRAFLRLQTSFLVLCHFQNCRDTRRTSIYRLAWFKKAVSLDMQTA